MIRHINVGVRGKGSIFLGGPGDVKQGLRLIKSWEHRAGENAMTGRRRRLVWGGRNTRKGTLQRGKVPIARGSEGGVLHAPGGREAGWEKRKVMPFLSTAHDGEDRELLKRD